MSISRFSGRSQNSRSLSILRLACLIMFLAGVLALESGCATGPFSNMFQKPRTGLTKGPFLLGVYPDRAALMWETETEGPCKLHYGRDGNFDKYVESVPETNRAGKKSAKKLAFIHKVWLEDLEPGRYFVPCRPEPTRSDLLSMVTAGPIPRFTASWLSR